MIEIIKYLILGKKKKKKKKKKFFIYYLLKSFNIYLHKI